jgi:hypothetical protein
MVVVLEDGEIKKYPLKSWLRRFPEHNPPGLHPDESTSHQLRRGLKRLGWDLEFTPSEVLIIRPDDSGYTRYADELVDLQDEEDSEDMDIDDEEPQEVTFGLERDLQSALRKNIKQLGSGLSIIDEGVERTTQAGRLDILAKDADERFVVIELKAGRATSRSIAQILSYMTAISQEEGNPVRGIIVAGGFSDRVVLAAGAVPNLKLMKYSFQFSFSPVD